MAASPEGSKKGSSSGGQQQRRRSHGNSHNNENSPQSSANSSSSHHQLSLRAPVIRHRDPKAPVVISGWLFKQGSDGLMLWKKRWFALSQYCLFYYDGPEEEKVLGSLLLPGYTIRPCLAGDRDRLVYRKYAFKAEHRNTRSFYLAADSRPSMIQWMNALSLAAILQDSKSLSITAELNRSQLDESTSSGSVALNGSRRSSKAVAENKGVDASFDSTAPDQPTGQRQPLYANAPPKPRRALNTSRDSYCSSSPDRSPERPAVLASSTPAAVGAVGSSAFETQGNNRAPTPSSAMYGHHQQVAVRQMQRGSQFHNGSRVWPHHQKQQQPHVQQRPASAEVTTLMQQQQQTMMRHRNSPLQPQAERRTPDAYGRFKTEYEDVYNNSSTASSTNSPQMLPAGASTATPSSKGFVVAHRSEVARRVPPRPHSVDFLQYPNVSGTPPLQQQPSDYWSSEQKYAQQVRQSVMRNYPRDHQPTDNVHVTPKESEQQQQQTIRRVVRDPAEISRDVKESALWSYVQAAGQAHSSDAHHRPHTKTNMSASQENLMAEESLAIYNPCEGQLQQQLFHRSASARLPKMAKQQPDLLNSSLADHPLELDNKRTEQREESMKRLLEWKQRMLQSPLTRKSGNSVISGGSGARSSERSTPTTADRDAPSPRMRIDSPLHPQQQQQQQQQQPSPIQLTDYGNAGMGNFATMRRTVARAAQDLLHQEQVYQQQQQQEQQQEQQQPTPLNVAFRASLKRPAANEKIKIQLDEEADVRKEFTYEYVLTEPSREGDGASCQEPEDCVPKVSWPRPSLMREKSSAVADLRARSESPSANRILFLKDVEEAQQMSPLKARPKPPPKPSLHDLQQAFQIKRNGLMTHHHMMMLEEDQLLMEQQQRLSYAESLPESLAGFAATIVSEDGMSPCPFEQTVSPLISECDWPHNTTGTGSSPAPLPDLMSLASVASGQLRSRSRSCGGGVHAPSENLYMNTQMAEHEADQSGSASVMEDHYLPMTSTKLVSARSPPPLPAANHYHFEENAYVEMTDNGKIKISPPGGATSNRGCNGKPSSVFAGVFDPSYRSPESPRYSEITECPSGGREQQEEDQPHYEFIYKASSQSEPVYMEVPQSGEEEEEEEEAAKGRKDEGTEEGRKADGDCEREEEAESNAIQERQTSSALDTTAMEEMDDGGRSLELIITPPRHPRFSISDTFRPASYFLRLETIPATEENGLDDQVYGQSDDQSDGELVSPPPIPTSPPPTDHQHHHLHHRPPIHHSRSQSLDTSQDYFQGRTSRNSIASELNHSVCGRPPSDLSQRRRPLTIVRSLEDLLVDSSDDHLAALTSAHNTSRISTAFQGSTQSLASNGMRNADLWNQPLYENVSQPVGGHVRQASRISVTSNTSRRMSSSPAGSIHSEQPQQAQPQQQRSRLGSVLSLNSNSSSVCRSEQSAGAPYYYSDLLSKTAPTPLEASLEDGNCSLRSSSSRSAQAQAAKQAYQHSMDRLRTVQKRSSPQGSTSKLGSVSNLECHHTSAQTPTSSGQSRPEPRQLLETLRKQQQNQQYQRAQTPDLLANHPEQDSFYYANGRGTAASRPSVAGDVMRRVRSLEGLLDEDANRSVPRSEWTDPQPNRSSVASHASYMTNGSNGHVHPPAAAEAPRYARDPTTRSHATKTLPSHARSPQGSASGDFVGGEFSPWDEDQLWRDKLRRASIRHTRSMDMLDEIQHDHQDSNQTNGKSHLPAEEDCYERLLQYSATLERTKRGQTYLDGYIWDEMEQRFREPGCMKSQKEAPGLPPLPPPPPLVPPPNHATPSSNNNNNNASHPFLGEGLPPPAFEIDREKLRQWDLMSTAAVPSSAVALPDNQAINKEGGRRPAADSSSNNTTKAVHSKSPIPPPSSSDAISRTTTTTSPSPPTQPPPPVPSTPIQAIRPSPFQQPVTPDLVRTPGGSSPVDAVAAGLNHATTGAAGKAINGLKVAYSQSGLTGIVSSTLVTTHQPPSSNQMVTGEIYHSDTDVPPKKGKLPPMIGHDQPSTHNGNRQPGDNKVQLSAGDLLGRTHEELVLLLIQLRRQSSALVKARDACLLEMESQVKLAALDISHRQECLIKTGELKHHVKELEKQLEKLKPMISLVDNMVKLGSSMSPQRHKKLPKPETSTAVKRNLTPMLHQQQQPKLQPSPYEPPAYSNVQQRNATMVFHSTPNRAADNDANAFYGSSVQGWQEAQISQLESKHHQLAQLEKFVREEGAAIHRLTRNQQVLRLAIRGIRQQTNVALQNADYGEVERCRQQQLFLERELSQIHSLLALSSKRLEDAAVEISRIEREISSLHQQLHRVGASNRQHLQSGAGGHSLNRSNNGREMAWLEAELNRVQQHVSQLQTKRQELSAQVNCLTSADYFLDLDESFNSTGTAKRKPISTWCETDLDSLNTIDRLTRNQDPSAMYFNTGGGSQHYQQEQEQQQEQLYQYDDHTMPVDISEADERMKRYYGIVPKQQPPPPSAADKAEIRTVRIVKRESEKRQRDKTKSRYDDSSFGMDELAEEDQAHGGSNGFYSEDPIMDDPVLSQFSHVLTLPRRGSKRDEQGRRSLSQRNSIAMTETPADARTQPLGPDQWKGSLRPRRNMSSLSLGDRNSSTSLDMDTGESTEGGLGSLDSTQRSPVLTPVYTSDAAREIIEEMRRQDMITARRAVPRHKRRHITISCSQPLVLEALTSDTRMTQGRARDDVDLQRALRFHHPFAPDVVRSTITQAIRINEKTIDNILCAPDKIVIPERYVPEQEVEELGEEEKQKRLKKTESIRRMLTGYSTGVDLPRPPSIAATTDIVELSEAKQLLAKERQQRDHFIGLNQMLVEEIKEKSKMAAAPSLSMESQFAA